MKSKYAVILLTLLALLALAGSVSAVADRANVYPDSVSIDFQYGVSPIVDYEATWDAYIDDTSATTRATNFGNRATLLVSGVTDSAKKLLIKWDITKIPQGSTITSASITFWVTQKGGSYDIYELKGDWNESTVKWTNFDTSIVGSTSLGDVDPDGTGAKTFSLNATGIALVKNWLANPDQNFGLIIQGLGTTQLTVASSENSTTNRRPKLTVNYDSPWTTPIIKGPYVQDMRWSGNNSIVVLWETNVASTTARVRYRRPGAPSWGYGDGSSSEVSGKYLHKATLDVIHGFRYEYQVEVNGSWYPSTPPTLLLDDPVSRVAAYGDSRTGVQIHQSVVTKMLSRDPKPELVLHTGDFVSRGQCYDDWWNEFMYPARTLIGGTPLYASPGNHEFDDRSPTEGGCTAAQDGSSWYDRLLSWPDSDSNQTGERWYAFTYGCTRFIALDTWVPFASGESQYNWLTKELSSPDYLSAKWRIVFTHYPPYSNSDGYGNGDATETAIKANLITHLVPLFKNYGVDIVIAGHAHNYERYADGGVQYVVTGGGGAPLRGGIANGGDGHESLSPAFPLTSVHHYTTMDIACQPSGLDFKAWAVDGTTFYDSFSLAPTPRTFTVTKRTDTNDGECTASDCSLREAIQAANYNQGHDTIIVPANALDYDLGSTLEVYDDVTIQGSGRDSTFIDGQGHTVFRVAGGARAEFATLEIKNGVEGIEGGAFVKVNNARIKDSSGTAVLGATEIEIIGSLINNNGAGLSYGFGQATIRNSDFNWNNLAVFVAESEVDISGATINVPENGTGIDVQPHYADLILDTVTISCGGAPRPANGTTGLNVFAHDCIPGTGGIQVSASNTEIRNCNLGIRSDVHGDYSNVGPYECFYTGVTSVNLVDNTTDLQETAPLGSEVVAKAAYLGIAGVLAQASGCQIVGTNMYGTKEACGIGPYVNDARPGRGHYSLLPGSPAIDAGGMDCPSTDKLGNPRTDGDGDGIVECDIGAIEYDSNPGLIFADSFEVGSFSAWSGKAIGGGDLSVTAAAAMKGGKGMQANINDNTSLYVKDTKPASEMRYNARFYFDPNSIAMTSGNVHNIFTGRMGSVDVLRVAFRRYTTNYQVRMQIRTDAATYTSGSWYTITDGPHAIEIEWKAATGAGANNGAISLWIDGVAKQTKGSIDNDTLRVDEVRLGPLAGIDTGTRGMTYFDAFESRRTGYIGLAGVADLAPEESVDRWMGVEEAAPGETMDELPADEEAVEENEELSDENEEIGDGDVQLYLPLMQQQ